MPKEEPTLRDDGLRTAAYWRERAEEARTMADAMKDKVAKATMREIAGKYDAMAERAQRREVKKP
jgi:hypothetical protein